jgi:hypothetical protein
MLVPEEPRQADSLLRFEWAVRALAQDPATQIALFPAFVVVADELALDFEQHYLIVQDTLADLGEDVVARVADLDRALDGMSGPAHLDLWTDDALREAPEWEAIRELARQVLVSAAWSEGPPPTGRATYIGPDA